MSFARSVVERLSRNRILKRRLPADFDRLPILVSPDSSLSFWRPRLKSNLFDFAREFVGPGSVVWDLGANVGLFTLAAAHRAGPSGRVVAVEPDPWLAELLRKSVAMQRKPCAPIQVIPAAVSQALGIASLNIARRGRASNFLAGTPGSPHAGGVRDTVQVVTITLDWLLECGPPPAVVKIDVEGVEMDVLRGAKRMLTEVRPVILCEAFRANRDRIPIFFAHHGYTLYNWDGQPRIKLERARGNNLALPGEG